VGNTNLGLAAVALLAVGVALGFAFSTNDSPAPAPDAATASLREDLAALQRTVSHLERRLAAPSIDPTAAAYPGSAELAVDGKRLRDLLPAGASPQRLSDAEARAKLIRAEALARARDAEREAARNVAAEMEREKRFIEDKARGGTMALLRGLQEKPTHLYSIVATRDGFLTHFTRHTKGPTIRGDQWDPHRPLEDGATVEFGEGVHTWDAEGYQHRKTFPKDLLFRGAGMDLTLLRINEVSSRQEIKSLTFEDLTIDCQNNYFSDLRSTNPVTIRMTRCRVVGFDMAAGGSVMLAAKTAAFYAEDCRFEAGFSRAGAGSGCLFRVKKGLLVRMDNCMIIGPFFSVFDANEGSTYQFTSCTLQDMSVWTKKSLEKPPTGVRLDSCSVTYATAELAGVRKKPRKLMEINAAWK